MSFHGFVPNHLPSFPPQVDPVRHAEEHGMIREPLMNRGRDLDAPTFQPTPRPAPDGEVTTPTSPQPPSDEGQLTRLLSLAADKTRLRILWLLISGERSVGSITSELVLPQPTISHHLSWLKTMHLVAARRQGKQVFYALGNAARAESNGSLSLRTDDAEVRLSRRE